MIESFHNPFEWADAKDGIPPGVLSWIDNTRSQPSTGLMSDVYSHIAHGWSLTIHPALSPTRFEFEEAKFAKPLRAKWEWDYVDMTAKASGVIQNHGVGSLDGVIELPSMQILDRMLPRLIDMLDEAWWRLSAQKRHYLQTLGKRGAKK